MNRTLFRTLSSPICFIALFASASAVRAEIFTWTNNGTNFNAAASWQDTTVPFTSGPPGINDTADFSGTATANPDVTSTIAVQGVSFGQGRAFLIRSAVSTNARTLHQNACRYRLAAIDGMSADVDAPNRISFQVGDDPQVSLDKGGVDSLSVGGGKFMYFVHPQSRIERIPPEDLKGSYGGAALSGG